MKRTKTPEFGRFWKTNSSGHLKFRVDDGDILNLLTQL